MKDHTSGLRADRVCSGTEWLGRGTHAAMRPCFLHALVSLNARAAERFVGNN